MKTSLLTVVLLAGVSPATARADSVADHLKPYGELLLFLGAQHRDAVDLGGASVKDLDLLYRVSEFSNLGFDAGYKGYHANFELGLGDSDGSRRVLIRAASGEYRAEKWSLLIGQTWSPFVAFSNEMADYYRSLGFGALYMDTTLQVKLSLYGFHLALFKPYVPVHRSYREQAVSSPTVSAGTTDIYDLETVEREVTTGLPLESIQAYIPAMVLGYELKTRQLRVRLGGALNSYLLEPVDYVSFNKRWLYSYLTYLNADLTVDAFTLKLSAGFSVNPANFGLFTQSRGNTTYAGGAAVALENIASDQFELKDVWNVQGYVEAGYKVNTDVALHAGYGYSRTQYPNEGTLADQAMEYYINARFTLGGLVNIVPALAVRDFMADMAGAEEGWELYGGVLASVFFQTGD